MFLISECKSLYLIKLRPVEIVLIINLIYTIIIIIVYFNLSVIMDIEMGT